MRQYLYLAIICFVVVIPDCLAGVPNIVELQKQIKLLEIRVSKLESVKTKETKHGLKVQNLKGNKIGSAPNNSSFQKGEIPPGMVEEFMKQIEEYKKKKSESQEFLDQLMKEDDERFK